MKKNVWVSMAKIILFTYVFSFLLLLLLALIMYRFSPSAAVISGGVIVIYFVSSLLGGFLTGKCMDKKKYLWGLGFGCVYVVLLVLLSWLFGKNFTLQDSRVISSFFVCAIGGMIGGMLS